MVMVNKTTACSHAELSGVRFETPSKVIQGVCSDAFTTRHYGHAADGLLFNFYVFSGSLALENYGDALAKFIRDEKLGTVVETPPMVNLKFHKDHSNKVYIWVVDHKVTHEWYKNILKNTPSVKGFELKKDDYNDLVEDIKYEGIHV